MKQILLSFLLLGVISLQGQSLTFSADTLSKSADKDSGLLDAKFNVTNNTSNTSTFYWTLETQNIPSEWNFTICDAELCYPPGTLTCPDGQQNVINAGESIVDIFKVSLIHNGNTGVGTTVFRCYDFTDPGVAYGQIVIEWEITGVSSIEELTPTKIQVYPNPASDFITINANKEISSLSIFDVVGKRISDFKYQAGSSYDVADLRKGIYYVSFKGKENQVLSTKRIVKN